MASEIVKIADLGKKITETSGDFLFAGVVALNRVAWKARKAVQELMDDVFTIRNKWAIRGVRVEQATKQNPEAQVYSNDWFMEVHDEGGRRKISDVPGGIKSIIPGVPALFWIPAGIREAAGVDFGKTIPTSLKPQNLLTNKRKIYGNKPFLLSKGNVYQIAVRKSKDRYPLEILYHGVSKPLDYQKRRWFQDEINDIYDRNLDREYVQALKEVLSGAIGRKSK